MAGFSKIYVLGFPGGFMGSDGVNSIWGLILVGDADRQWLEPHYFDPSVRPLGRVRALVPNEPDHPDALLDACIAFFPQKFRTCPSFTKLDAAMKDVTFLDFHLGSEEIPEAWAALREEARPIFASLDIWQAELVPYQHPETATGPGKGNREGRKPRKSSRRG